MGCTEELEALEIEEKRRELQQLRAQNNCMVERARAARAKEAEHKKILAEKEHKGPGLRKTSPSACPKAVRPKDVAEQKKSGDLRVRGATPVKHVPEKKVESALRLRKSLPRPAECDRNLLTSPRNERSRLRARQVVWLEILRDKAWIEPHELRSRHVCLLGPV